MGIISPEFAEEEVFPLVALHFLNSWCLPALIQASKESDLLPAQDHFTLTLLLCEADGTTQRLMAKAAAKL